MLLGYARVSKADGSQLLDLQVDALREAGIDSERIYQDRMSGRHDQRPGLDASRPCARATPWWCLTRPLREWRSGRKPEYPIWTDSVATSGT